MNDRSVIWNDNVLGFIQSSEIIIGDKSMNNYISRRSFMHKAGMMSFLCMSPDILNGLDCFANVLSDSTSFKARTPTCFVGVGIYGRVLATKLYKNNPSNRKPFYPCDLDRIVFLDPIKIDFYSQPFNDNLIFLAGSIKDEKFWATRDFIISKNPKFIITIVWPEYGYTVDESILSENECCITLPDHKASGTACNIINDIYMWLNGNPDHLGKLNNLLPKGAGFGFSMESSTDKNVPELRCLFDQHLNELKKCKKLHMLIFEDDKTDYGELMDFFKIAQEEVGNNTEISWMIFGHWDQNPKFRATILAS
jgi:hypothetical protein